MYVERYLIGFRKWKEMAGVKIKSAILSALTKPKYREPNINPKNAVTMFPIVMMLSKIRVEPYQKARP